MSKRNPVLLNTEANSKLILPDAALQRFWSKVDKQSENGSCWLWTGSLKDNGYAQFTWGRTQKDYAHRVSYRIHKGIIPKNLQINHSCDIRNCVNPNHLWMGTQMQNMQDCVEKGRSQRGVKHFKSKLTDEDIRQIRKLWTEGFRPQWLLGERFGVQQSIISMIVNRVKWRHVA